MQIPKTLLTCGAAALCLVATSARAVDTDTDIKLREALHQKMAEVGAETSDTAPSKPAAVKPPKPPKAPKASKVSKAPAPVAPAAPAPVAPAEVSQPVAPAPVVVQPAPAAAPTSGSADQDRLREAVRARLAAGETPATPAQPVVTNGTDVQPAVSTTTVVAPAPAAAPSEPAPAAAPTPTAPVTLVAPPLPISGSKEQRLSALLQQYKTDQITPQQYHEQRAKILAE